MEPTRPAGVGSGRRGARLICCVRLALGRPVIMDVTVRPFTNGDIGAWQRWKSAIDLDKFMSRSAPARFDGTVIRRVRTIGGL
jgi:hypothetical protein